MLQGSALERRLNDNLQAIQQQIAIAAAGRAVDLVCVTKYAPDDWFEALLNLRVAAVGESHLPQATRRCQQVRTAAQGTVCHLLGAQQSRKVPLIPESCDVFQALDRLKIAQLLNAHLASRSSHALPLDRCAACLIESAGTRAKCRNGRPCPWG
jgi:uncharacterized pyridoxal phosphate-containing UPF0001 family protein